MNINTIPNDLESTSSTPGYEDEQVAALPQWELLDSKRSMKTSSEAHGNTECVEQEGRAPEQRCKTPRQALSVSSKLLGLPPCSQTGLEAPRMVEKKKNKHTDSPSPSNWTGNQGVAMATVIYD